MRTLQEVAQSTALASAIELMAPVEGQTDFDRMGVLYQAGIQRCFSSGMPVFDPQRCSLRLKSALWTLYTTLANCINTEGEVTVVKTSWDSLLAILAQER